MTSQHCIALRLAALALVMGGQAWAQTRPTLQGLQDQLNNTYTRQQVNNLARTPDPACADNANRYVDCGNGTVTDTVTGLIWLKQADCLGAVDHTTAATAAATLQSGQCGLTDGSRPGDWRLPDETEWQDTLMTGPACQSPSLTNTNGTGCYADGPQPFTGVEPNGVYWSATASLDRPAAAWSNDLQYREYSARDKTEDHYAWPVRGKANTQPVVYEPVDEVYSRIRSQISEGLSLAFAAEMFVVEYVSSGLKVPKDNAEAGFDSVPTSYVTQVSIVNGRIDITYGNDANAAITGKVLSLTPYVASYGAIYWRCGNAAAPDGVLAGTGTSGPVAVYQGTLIDNTYLPVYCRP